MKKKENYNYVSCVLKKTNMKIVSLIVSNIMLVYIIDNFCSGVCANVIMNIYWCLSDLRAYQIISTPKSIGKNN